MQHDPIDPETLAALLDGTLSAHERADALSRTSSSEESYDDLIETTAILGALAHETDGTDTPDEPLAPAEALTAALMLGQLSAVDTAAVPVDSTLVRRDRPRWRSRALMTAVPLMAAAVLLVIVIPSVSRRSNGILAAADALRTDESPSAPIDRATWPALRGAEDVRSARVSAFRSGASMIDLEAAIQRGDEAGARALAASLSRLAATMEAGAPLAERLDRLSSAPSLGAVDRRERESIASDLRLLAGDPSWFTLGVWSEAARLAAYAGQTEVLRPHGAVPTMLDRALGDIQASVGSDRLMSERVAAVRAYRGRTLAPADLRVLAAALDSLVIDAGR